MTKEKAEEFLELEIISINDIRPINDIRETELVRSVLKKELKNPEDMRFSLLEHFERPIDVTPSSKKLLEK